jgi:phosphotriesterase-related protein
MVDFAGADKTGPHRWDPDEVFRVMLPHLKAARAAGVVGFVECTPMFLGRDVRLLRRISKASGLHIVTNTGLYKEPFLPPYAFTEDADALAARWTAEWRDGIEGTGIKPGFIKIAVNPGTLIEVQRKIVRAAARCSRATGLVIACHTGHGQAALESLDILRDEHVETGRFIFVHADAEADPRLHHQVAEAGAWVEYDSIGWRPADEHVRLIAAFLERGHADRLLLSHDAGWYHVGEPGGGQVKPYTPLMTELPPLLERAGVERAVLQRLTVDNVRRAFEVAV